MMKFESKKQAENFLTTEGFNLFTEERTNEFQKVTSMYYMTEGNKTYTARIVKVKNAKKYMIQYNAFRNETFNQIGIEWVSRKVNKGLYIHLSFEEFMAIRTLGKEVH